jgi:hypothetical protein
VSAQPSEDRRLASTLDERIARDCERSGVSFHVDDDGLLDRLADQLDATLAFGTGPLNGRTTDPT